MEQLSLHPWGWRTLQRACMNSQRNSTDICQTFHLPASVQILERQRERKVFRPHLWSLWCSGAETHERHCNRQRKHCVDGAMGTVKRVRSAGWRKDGISLSAKKQLSRRAQSRNKNPEPERERDAQRRSDPWLLWSHTQCTQPKIS